MKHIEALQNLADRLMRLHRHLEPKDGHDADCMAARQMEESLAAGQPATGDVERAKSLLTKYGF